METPFIGFLMSHLSLAPTTFVPSRRSQDSQARCFRQIGRWRESRPSWPKDHQGFIWTLASTIRQFPSHASPSLPFPSFPFPPSSSSLPLIASSSWPPLPSFSSLLLPSFQQLSWPLHASSMLILIFRFSIRLMSWSYQPTMTCPWKMPQYLCRRDRPSLLID